MTRIRILLTMCSVCSVSCLSSEGTAIETKKSIDKFVLCHTSSCNENAKKMLDSIDTSIDPCDNFYQHTCGKWLRNHLISGNETGVGVYWELEKKVAQEIIELLDSAPILPLPKDGTTPSEAKLKQLYEQCMNEAQREKLQAGPLLDLLEYSLGGWPILKPGWTSSKFNATDALIKSFLAGSEPFFVVDVIPDYINPQIPNIVINEPETFAKHDILIDDVLGEMYAESYKQYMFDVTELLRRDSYLDVAVKAFAPNVTEIFRLELSIIAARLPTLQRGALKYAHRSNFSDLKIINFFESALLRNLSTYIHAYVAMAKVTAALHDNTTVFLANMPLLLTLDQQFVEFERQGEEGSRRLANSIGWQIIKTYINKISKNYFDLSSAYGAKLYGHPASPDWSLAMRCFSQLKRYMPLALGALYVRKKISTDVRKKAMVIAKTVQVGFAELLDAATWLDKSTHKAAVNKLSSLIFDVGYPQALANTTFLNAYYDDFIIGESYMKSIVNVAWSTKSRNLRRLSTPFLRDEPITVSTADITTVSGHYEPDRNRLLIHAAMLHPPFFDPDGPHYANYAGLGADTGHEITHAFDGLGSRYDEQGVWRNWWSNSSRTAFNDRQYLMLWKYDSYVTEFGKVKGELTKWENVADNGGYRAAYKAYMRYLQHFTQPELIPVQLKHYSPQQLFFLSLGMKMCLKNRPPVDRLYLVDDRHSPAEWRINGAMSNMVEFSQAFNCSARDKMNPPVKRIVW